MTSCNCPDNDAIVCYDLMTFGHYPALENSNIDGDGIAYCGCECHDWDEPEDFGNEDD